MYDFCGSQFECLSDTSESQGQYSHLGDHSGRHSVILATRTDLCTRDYFVTRVRAVLSMILQSIQATASSIGAAIMAAQDYKTT